MKILSKDEVIFNTTKKLNDKRAIYAIFYNDKQLVQASNTKPCLAFFDVKEKNAKDVFENFIRIRIEFPSLYDYTSPHSNFERCCKLSRTDIKNICNLNYELILKDTNTFTNNCRIEKYDVYVCDSDINIDSGTAIKKRKSKINECNGQGFEFVSSSESIMQTGSFAVCIANKYKCTCQTLEDVKCMHRLFATQEEAEDAILNEIEDIKACASDDTNLVIIYLHPSKSEFLTQKDMKILKNNVVKKIKEDVDNYIKEQKLLAAKHVLIKNKIEKTIVNILAFIGYAIMMLAFIFKLFIH